MFLTKLKLGTAAVLCVCLIGGSFSSLGIAQDAKPRMQKGTFIVLDSSPVVPLGLILGSRFIGRGCHP